MVRYIYLIKKIDKVFWGNDEITLSKPKKYKSAVFLKTSGKYGLF